MTHNYLSPRKTSLLAVLMVSMFWLSSCHDKDEPKDAIAPEVSFTDLTTDEVILNSVPIKVNATDNDSIATVDVYIDGNLIETLTTIPYETTWDSNTVSDGSHVIKVVVTDSSGNKTEKEVTIVVKNILVTLDFKADQLTNLDTYKERGFLFLSDETGKLITSVEYTNGQHIELKSSSFNGEKFFLTEALVTKANEDPSIIRLWTYPKIERGGKWVVFDWREGEDDDTYVGEATLNFTNAAASANYNVSSDGDQTYADESNTSSSVWLRKSPSNLYVWRTNGNNIPAPTYKLFSNIVTGANTIDLSLVSQAMTKVTRTQLNAATQFSVEVTGFPVANNYIESYWVAGSYGDGSTDIDVYYPGTAFPSYYFDTTIDGEDFSYYEAGPTLPDNFSIPAHQVNLSYANNKITYSASGNYDIAAITYFNGNGIDNISDSWFFALPLGSNLNIPKLELPVLLTDFSIPTIETPYYHEIYDFEGISNYNDLKAYIRNSNSGVGELGDYGKNYLEVAFYSSSSSGRKKTPNRNIGLFTKIKRRSK